VAASNLVRVRTFLATASRPQIQEFLKELDNDDVVRILKGSSSKVQSNVFGAMNKRAADLVRSSMATGPVRVADRTKSANKALRVVNTFGPERGKGLRTPSPSPAIPPGLAKVGTAPGASGRPILPAFGSDLPEELLEGLAKPKSSKAYQVALSRLQFLFGTVDPAVAEQMAKKAVSDTHSMVMRELGTGRMSIDDAKKALDPKNLARIEADVRRKFLTARDEVTQKVGKARTPERVKAQNLRAVKGVQRLTGKEFDRLNRPRISGAPRPPGGFPKSSVTPSFQPKGGPIPAPSGAFDGKPPPVRPFGFQGPPPRPTPSSVRGIPSASAAFDKPSAPATPASTPTTPTARPSFLSRLKPKGPIGGGIAGAALFAGATFAPELARGVGGILGIGNKEKIKASRDAMQAAPAQAFRQLRALRLQEAMKQNEAILASREPTLYKELLARRKLPEGAVMLGGPAQRDVLDSVLRDMLRVGSE
jgi:hypothetical protein